MSRGSPQLLFAVQPQLRGLFGHLPWSLTKQRWDILPNPGRLENVIRDADEYLELIPGAKNRSKNTITLSKSDFHTETNGPANSLEDRAMSPPEGRPEELALTG